MKTVTLQGFNKKKGLNDCIWVFMQKEDMTIIGLGFFSISLKPVKQNVYGKSLGELSKCQIHKEKSIKVY